MVRITFLCCHGCLSPLSDTVYLRDNEHGSLADFDVDQSRLLGDLASDITSNKKSHGPFAHNEHSTNPHALPATGSDLDKRVIGSPSYSTEWSQTPSISGQFALPPLWGDGKDREDLILPTDSIIPGPMPLFNLSFVGESIYSVQVCSRALLLRDHLSLMNTIEYAGG